MSNFGPLGSPRPLERTTSMPNLTRSSSKTETSSTTSSSSTSSTSSTESSRQLGSRSSVNWTRSSSSRPSSSQNLLSETVLVGSLDQANPRQILSQSQRIPRPSSMQQLPTVNPIVTNVTQTVNPNPTAPVNQTPVQFSDLLTTGVKQAVQNFDAKLKEVTETVDLTQTFVNEFRADLKSLDKANTLIGKDAKLARVNSDSQQHASQFMSALSSDSNLSTLIQFKSDDQLRDMLTGAVGQIKGYHNTPFSELSQRKQNFINSLVQGIRQGAHQQQVHGQPESLSLALQQVRTEARQSMENQSPMNLPTLQVATGSDQDVNQLLQSNGALNGVRMHKSVVQAELLAGLREGVPGRVTSVGDDEVSPESFSFKGQNFSKVRDLGRGQAGMVSLFRDDQSGKEYALKPLDSMKSQDEVKALIQAMGPQGTGSPHLVNGAGFFMHDNNLYVLSEVMPNGELADNVNFVRQGVQNNLITPEMSQQIILQQALDSAKGLAHLHQQGLIHRDIKEQNFFMDTQGHLRIADLGEAKLTQAPFVDRVGTAEYLAPEVIESRPATHTSDNWSFGIMLHNMLRGSHPFEAHASGPAAGSESGLNGVRFAKGESCLDHRTNPPTPFNVSFANYPPGQKELFEGLFHADPNQRMSMDRAVQLLEGMVQNDPKREQINLKLSEYGQANKSLDKTLNNKAEEQITQNHPTIPSQGEIDMRLKNVDTNIKWYSDPTNNKQGMTAQAWGDKLQEYQNLKATWQGHQQTRDTTLQQIKTQLLQLPEFQQSQQTINRLAGEITQLQN